MKTTTLALRRWAVEDRGTGEWDVVEGNRRIAGYLSESDARLCATAPLMLDALQRIRAATSLPSTKALCDVAIRKATSGAASPE